MDSAILKTHTTVLLGLLSSGMSDDMFSIAESITLAELGWTFPIDDGIKSVWAAKRCRRHVCDIMLSSAVDSVKHKQTNLEQKFDHLRTLIKEWDEEFSKAIEENYSLFANVDVSKAFGTYNGAGFVYDFVGNDVTDYGT